MMTKPIESSIQMLLKNIMSAISCTILYRTIKEIMNRISIAHKRNSVLAAAPFASQAIVIFALTRKATSSRRWMISTARRRRP